MGTTATHCCGQDGCCGDDERLLRRGFQGGFQDSPEGVDQFDPFIISGATPEAWHSAVQRVELEVTTLSCEHMSLRLARLAECEEEANLAERYKEVLQRVLALLSGSVAPGVASADTRPTGPSPLTIVVAPEELLREYIAFEEPDVIVLTRQAQASFVHDEDFRRRVEERTGAAGCRRAPVDQGAFAVSHCSGEVLTGDARFAMRGGTEDDVFWCVGPDSAEACSGTGGGAERSPGELMSPPDLAQVLDHGVVFEHAAGGEGVYIFPAQDVRRGQGWHVVASGARS